MILDEYIFNLGIELGSMVELFWGGLYVFLDRCWIVGNVYWVKGGKRGFDVLINT